MAGFFLFFFFWVLTVFFFLFVLGEEQERSGDLQPQEEIVPSVHVTPAAAIRALGYSNAHQYERHALLKTIAKEEERIQGYKAREAEQNGGLGKIKRRWRPVESRAERKRRLEREIQHEEGEVEGEEQVCIHPQASDAERCSLPGNMTRVRRCAETVVCWLSSYATSPCVRLLRERYAKSGIDLGGRGGRDSGESRSSTR